MKPSGQKRRHFLKTSASAALAIPTISRGKNLNGRINHACIGVGGMMGFHDLQNFKSHPKT